MYGWGPWIKGKDLTLHDKEHTLLTSGGLAATRVYGPMTGHIWAEFNIPGYGWIPGRSDMGEFGHQANNKLILSKGRDVQMGPDLPKEGSEEYGDQWIPIHEGRIIQ